MSYNFKKIMDLDLVTEVPEGANVLIETDGATKRLPSTAIKSDDSYTKEEVYTKEESDAKYLAKADFNIETPDLAQNDSTAADYVKNRTHWSEELFRYVWDGNTDGKETVSMSEMATYVKVVDKSLTAENLIGATMYVNGVLENNYPLSPEAVLDDTCVIDNGDGSVYVSWNIPVVVSVNKAMDVDMNGATASFPSAGVYVLYISADSIATPIYCSELSKVIYYKLDEKFIPDTIARAETVPTVTTFYIGTNGTYLYTDSGITTKATKANVTSAKAGVIWIVDTADSAEYSPIKMTCSGTAYYAITLYNKGTYYTSEMTTSS